MARPWFAVKTYGIGLAPQGAPGWIALVVFIALVGIAIPTTLALRWPAWAAPVVVVVLVAAFLAPILAKSDGRRWRWRWGGR